MGVDDDADAGLTGLAEDLSQARYFQTSIEFRPTLAVQHDHHAATHGPNGRQELWPAPVILETLARYRTPPG